MRILSAAILAAFFTAGTVSAYAQTAAPSAAPSKPAATKAKGCSKRAEADCTAPDCTWTPPSGSQTAGKCKKAKK